MTESINESKWSDWEYHALQAIKELSMAEDHLIAQISTDSSDIVKEILGKVRNIRKQVETGVTE